MLDSIRPMPPEIISIITLGNETIRFFPGENGAVTCTSTTKSVPHPATCGHSMFSEARYKCTLTTNGGHLNPDLSKPMAICGMVKKQ